MPTAFARKGALEEDVALVVVLWLLSSVFRNPNLRHVVTGNNLNDGTICINLYLYPVTTDFTLLSLFQRQNAMMQYKYYK